MKANAGKYICVDRGRHPDEGRRDLLHDRRQDGARDRSTRSPRRPGAIIAIGSCASWGGIPSADPNPTGATGAPTVLKGKTVVTLPGCPANPYIFLGTALQYATLGTLPALDDKGRPMFAYGRTIHEHCPRRAHFDAGRFVQQFGDEGHRQGWCLYKLGCKGPATHANCSALHFGEVVGRLADRPRPPLLRLHRADARLPRAAARHGHDRAADAARHLPADPRRAGRASSADRDRRRRPRGGRRARRRLWLREEARRRAAPHAARPGRGGEAVNPGRRRALRVLAGTGVGHRDGRGGPGARRPRAEGGPSRSDGHALRHHAVHRLQGLRRGLPRGERSRSPTSSLDGLHQAPLDLNGQTKNVIKLYKEGDTVSFMKSQCMHCVDPGLRGRLHAALAAEGRDDRHRRLRPDYCVGCRYCQMACPFNVPKFEFDKAVPKIVKCELCRHRVERREARRRRTASAATRAATGPACCEVCPRGAVIYGKRAELLRRGQAAHRREPRRATCRDGLRRDRGRRHAGALPVPRAVREARPARPTAPQGVPAHRLHDPGGPLQGLRRPGGALRRARRRCCWRNREEAGDGDEEVQP